MRINKLGKRYKNIKRYREIWSVLSKYGFSILADKMKIEGSIKGFILKKSTKLSEKYTRAQRVRMAIEELGPTFIKLGQILSTRYDILPEDIVNELKYLQDRVNEFELSTAKQIFASETKQNIEEVFCNFEEKPLAAASIGQVYRAKLKSGERVVVKIQRPNLKDIIDRDIDILYNVAKLIDEHFNKQGPVHAVDIVKEFAYFIYKEIDYTYEGQNCQSFFEIFKDDKRVLVPKVYWDYTTKRILVMEEIKGVKVSNIPEINRRNWDKEKIADIGANVFLEQIFLHGFFHGDPHPGNILIVNQNKISFIDFGIVGYIDKYILNFIIALLKAGQDKDVDRIVESLFKINALTKETDEIDLRKDLYYILNYYFNVPINRLNFGEAFNEILMTAYKHKLKVPPQLILLMKSIITLEGTAKELNPQFSLSEISKEIIKKVTIKRLNPKKIVDEALEYSIDSFDNLKEIPRQVNNILNKIEKNQIKITMKQEGLKRLENEINSMTNKISLSLLVSALIVGSSIVIQSNKDPKILGISLFGVLGYVIGAIFGIGLVLSILINNKRNR